jgi:hypothetical protein
MNREFSLRLVELDTPKGVTFKAGANGKKAISIFMPTAPRRLPAAVAKNIKHHLSPTLSANSHWQRGRPEIRACVGHRIN